MKKLKFPMFLAFVLSGWLLVACGGQKESTAPEQAVTAEDVEKETQEALETATAYTQQQRQEYQERVKAKLDEVEKNMDELQARAADLTTEGKAELDQEMQELHKKQEAMKKNLNELREATGTAWDDIKAGMDAAMEDLESAVAKAASRFKQDEGDASQSNSM